MEAAPLRAIERPERTDRQQQMVRDAGWLADDIEPSSQLVGYVILAAYSDGATRSAGYRPTREDHMCGAALWQAWIGEALNNHFAYRESVEATHDVLNGEHDV